MTNANDRPFVDMMPQTYLEALARYNAECARGIVHTKAYDRQMAEIQQTYDRNERRRLAHRGEQIERAEGQS